jgi:serine/threonine protein kinase
MVKGFRLPQMNTDMLTELTDELIVCSALYHPHIIQFLGVAQNEGCIYAVVEKAKLGSLQNELLRQADGDTGFYEKSELYEDHTHLVLSVAHQIAKAMLFLHSFDQVHASLSSANVVFGNDYTVKVTDVGIRKLKAFAEVSAVQRFSTAWSAPEVLQGQPAGKASDVYAFGMICYELLTKKIPFESLELKEIRKQVCKLHRRPVLPSRGLPDVPKAFINMIKECWMTDPKDRPSFQEIIELLQDPMTVHLDLQELQDEYKQ